MSGWHEDWNHDSADAVERRQRHEELGYDIEPRAYVGPTPAQRRAAMDAAIQALWTHMDGKKISRKDAA